QVTPSFPYTTLFRSAVLAQVLGIVALVCQQPAAALARPAWLARDANLIQECLGIRDVAGLARRQQKAQRHAVGIADHVDLGSQRSEEHTSELQSREH